MTLRQLRVFRGDQDAVSPIIGEVMMVAIVVVLASVTYITVSGMLMLEDEEKLSMTMRFPDVEGHSRGATPTSVWDVELVIIKVIPNDYKLVWNDLFINIRSADGSLLQPKSPGTPDNPAMYDNIDADGIDVEFWYVETSAGDTMVGEVDAIKVTGMDTSYEGATIQITKAGELIASVTLPTNFK